MASLWNYLKFRFVLLLFGVLPLLRGDSVKFDGSQESQFSEERDPQPSVPLEEPVTALKY